MRAGHPRAARIAALVAPCAIAMIAVHSAAARGLDEGASTPVARPGTAAAASTPISRAGLDSRLADVLGSGGTGTAAWVYDTGSQRALFGLHQNRRRILASNTKLFTTATVLDRLGAGGRLETRVWAGGPVPEQHEDATAPDEAGRVVRGDLYLVGDGDPALGSRSFASRHNLPLTRLRTLADRVRAAGVRQVDGKLRVDATVFDRRRGTGVRGWRTYVGPLSGLAYNSGEGRDDPAGAAGRAFKRALRRAGVRVGKVARGHIPGKVRDRDPIATVRSVPIARLVGETNESSNNFFAEMLLKRLAAGDSGHGTTRRGAARSRRFARGLGARVRQRDGSGLSRSDRATPHDVGTLLARMAEHRAGRAFTESLPVAGREGTVRNRMRGTAAQGRCGAKTGTLTGVSALSGYCGSGDHPVVFSILMQGVALETAHSIQDRAAALIARYR